MSKVPIVFHLAAGALRDPASMAPFYQKLIGGLAARGADLRQVLHDRAVLADQVARDEAFHIVDHGGVRHDRVLNCGVAYVYPFWHMDPWGIRAFSSIAAMEFDASSVDPVQARGFADRLRNRLIGKRASRYEQPGAVTVIPQGCIAVFLQSETHRLVGETCHLTLRQMVDAVVARDDPRPIVIKPHPRDFDDATHRMLRALARRDQRVTVTSANIHDILSAADVVVTINSAVGIEAMVHRKPVVLCGQADFHHCAVTVREPGALDQAIASARHQDWPHDAYLYWYFAQRCLSATSPTLIDDLLARIRATGFDTDRFDLSRPD
jgi:Capsule polysaccharide biosynthesis protein